jgi:hypothetical protein
MDKKLSKDELVRLVELLITGKGTVAEQEEWLRQVERNVPDPEVSDLIYWSDTSAPGHAVTAVEIVEAALNYKPILLGPAESSPSSEGDR